MKREGQPVYYAVAVVAVTHFNKVVLLCKLCPADVINFRCRLPNLNTALKLNFCCGF